MTKKSIIGINTGHDGGAAILVDGKIIAAIGEERLTRQKYTHGYLNAVSYCLNEAGLKINDVDHFVFSSYGKNLPKKFIGELEIFGVDPQKSLRVDHHLSHAYGSFCMSGFEESLVIVIDGQGNNTDTETYYLANSNGIKRIGGNDPKRSVAKGIGRTYEAVTNFLGWKDQNAGKTMGLSALGKLGRYKPTLFELDDLTVKSKLEHKYEKGIVEFSKKFGLDFGPIYSLGKTKDGADLSAYLQNETEKIIVELVEKLIKKTGVKNVCLAGGVALNCGTNTALYQNPMIDNLFVLPASSDRGQCLGNALYGYHKLTGKLVKKRNYVDYLGKNYSDTEIRKALEKNHTSFVAKTIPTYEMVFEKKKNIAKEVAKLINKNKIVAWFQGRSEFGPRALGNRSLVCNPTTLQMKDLLNNKVKYRENFRPFAPSCLEEKASEYFQIKGKSPYMLLTVPVIKEKQSKIPAIVHVDGSARLQTVNRTDNKMYYDLINEFYKLSGVPVVLNTSFNNQEPIVETPGDAVNTFLSTNIDYLAIGNYLVKKRKII